DSCNGYKSPSANDAWYSFVADTSDVRIIVAGSVYFDAVVFLMDSCNGHILDCSDTSSLGGTEAMIEHGLTVGNTYYVRVYSWQNIQMTTTFTICVTSDIALGIKNNDVNNTLVIYPNPA